MLSPEHFSLLYEAALHGFVVFDLFLHIFRQLFSGVVDFGTWLRTLHGNNASMDYAVLT